MYIYINIGSYIIIKHKNYAKVDKTIIKVLTKKKNHLNEIVLVEKKHVMKTPNLLPFIL